MCVKVRHCLDELFVFVVFIPRTKDTKLFKYIKNVYYQFCLCKAVFLNFYFSCLFFCRLLRFLDAETVLIVFLVKKQFSHNYLREI